MMHTSTPGMETSGPLLKILVVDDNPINLSLLQGALKMAGHTVIMVTSGEEALACFEREQPEVVLMDVMMPGMGGIETTRRLREMTGDRWVPILFISALNHSTDMVRGLEAGGDDYLPKPVDLALLLAKIRALQRVAALQEKLRHANVELEAYRHTAEQDMTLASAVMERMIQSTSMDVEGVELWLQPAARLSGDLLVAHMSHDDNIYLLLADAMGHGLPAALPVMPLIQVFSAMSRKGFRIQDIAREMNAQLKALLPPGNFVAVTLASIDRTNQLIDIWNGGNPPALLTDPDGHVTRRFAAHHPALGILSDKEFNATTEACQWADTQCFTLYSDGLVEARDPQGSMFGEQRLLAALVGEAPHRRLRDALIAHLDGQAGADDISLATVSLQQKS